MRHSRFICVATLLLAGCASPATQVETPTIDRSFTIADTKTRSGNTRLVVAAYAENRGGKAMICATAGAKGEKSFEGEWPTALMNRLRVFIDDERIVRQTPFGATYPGVETLTGRTSNCAVTDAPWKPSYENRKVRVRVGKIQLRS